MRVIKTSNAARGELKKYASPASSKNNNKDLSMASESLENVFKNSTLEARRESVPNTKQSFNKSNYAMPSLKKDQIRKESMALKAIDKRRKTHHQGRVKDQLSIWGAAEDSIISQVMPRGIDREMDESPSPSNNTAFRPSYEQSIN